MKYIDNHTHITYCQKELSVEEHHQLLKKNEVTYVLDAGIHPDDYKKRKEHLQKYSNILMGVALAPHSQKEGSLEDIPKIVKVIEEEKPIAISEIGLDYTMGRDKSNMIDILEAQLELSKQYNIPFFLHLRGEDAYRDMIDILKNNQSYNGAIHCFTGTKKEAQILLDMGILLSISGIVTFKNATSLKEVVEYVPLNSLLTETDSPYLTPTPYRGRPNNSSYVQYIALEIAKIKGGDIKKNLEQLYENSLSFLKIPRE